MTPANLKSARLLLALAEAASVLLMVAGFMLLIGGAVLVMAGPLTL